MKSEPLIGLLCSNLNRTSQHKVFEGLPCTFVLFTTAGINWRQKTIKGVVMDNGKWQKAITRFPDAVYNRRYSKSGKITNKIGKSNRKG